MAANKKQDVIDDLPDSMVGCWNVVYERKQYDRKVYDDSCTAKVAGGFLNSPNITTVEDWGCGYGGFREYIGEHQDYIGVDGSKSRFADLIVDLEQYKSDVDAVHMRHVLEHNPNWERVLTNALKSFSKKMVLTLFTPFQDETRVILLNENWLGTGKNIPDIGFNREEIIGFFSEVKWFSIENIRTETDYKMEHMFFLERD